jgi:hypothetical protein
VKEHRKIECEMGSGYDGNISNAETLFFTTSKLVPTSEGDN